MASERVVTEERAHNSKLDVWAVLLGLLVTVVTGVLLFFWRRNSWEFHWAWIAVPGSALVALIYLGYQVRSRTHAWWPLFLLLGLIVGIGAAAVFGIRRYEANLREEGAAAYKAGLQQALNNGQLGEFDPAIAREFRAAVDKEISPERADAEAAVWAEVAAALQEGRSLNDPVARAALESLLAMKDAATAAELASALAAAETEKETAVAEAQALTFERAIQVALGEIPEDELTSQERLFLRALQAPPVPSATPAPTGRP